MKVLKTVKIAAISLLLIPLLIVSGCVFKPIMCDGSPLCIGFNYDYNISIFQPSGSAVAVKGDKNEWNIDDIILDFYYGHMRYYLPNSNITNYTRIGVGLYFYKNDSSLYNPQEDYTNVEGLHFITKIDEQDFFSPDYLVTATKKEGRVFKQHSMISVPPELFDAKQYGDIYLRMFEIYYSLNDNMYKLEDEGGGGGVRIRYEIIGDNTVELYK